MTLAIVGTGTGVGKTLVAATVLARYGGELPLAYWKPVATGSRDERDTATVAALAGGGATILAESYLFPEPLSPHLAARLAGGHIDPARLLADFSTHLAAHRALLIETAGGLLVPLVEARQDPASEEGEGAAEDQDEAKEVAAASSRRGWPFRAPRAAPAAPAVPAAGAAPAIGAPVASGAPPAGAYLQSDLLVDMARRGALACLVVAHSGLGTINHTLLTLEALRARGLAVAGVVLNGPPNRENRLAIQRFGGVDTVFEVPHVAPVDHQEVAGLARFFDHAGLLAPLLSVSGPPGLAGPGLAGAGLAGSGPARPGLPGGGIGERPRRTAPS